MAAWDMYKIIWGFTLLLTGALGDSVIDAKTIYPPPVCAVKGSTVTLLCTFTPRQLNQVPVEIDRVVWCQNQGICQGVTPSVYDSDKPNQNPRYSYLGDKKGNCTLQIKEVKKEDDATLFFRMEASDGVSHHTERSGVRVTVAEATRMNIKSSIKDRELTRGDTVSLTCTNTIKCTFHDLEVTWFKDGSPQSETGPSLQLGPLTAKDSGNYTCGLTKNDNTQSPPIRIYVEGEDEEEVKWPLIVGVVVGSLLALFTVIMVVYFIKRKRAAANKNQRSAGSDVEPKEGAGHGQELGQVDEEVSYAAVQFKHKKKKNSKPSRVEEDVSYAAVQFKNKNQASKPSRVEEDVNYAAVQFKNKNQASPEKEADDAIIYSSVAKTR